MLPICLPLNAFLLIDVNMILAVLAALKDLIFVWKKTCPSGLIPRNRDPVLRTQIRALLCGTCSEHPPSLCCEVLHFSLS